MRVVITVQENTPYQAYFDGKEGDVLEVLVETTFCDSISVTEPDYYLMQPEKDREKVEGYFRNAEKANKGRK